MYPLLYRLLISRTDAEAAHRVSFAALRALDALAPARWALRALMRCAAGGPSGARRAGGAGSPGGAEPAEVLGLPFPNRLGLAAGFDKDGAGVRAMALLGFGHIEVGTVTAHGQPGNERPRLFRLPAHAGILNRMGFNNSGARAVALNLRRARAQLDRLPHHRRPVIGVNIGKTKVVPLAGAVEDYRTSARILAPLADYLVINVSSPNTPGLRELQAVEALRPIIAAVKEIADRAPAPRSTLGRVPLLIKIAPDLADDDVAAIVDLALETGADGLIATNTLLDRGGLAGRDRALADAEAGGISGPAVAARSFEVLRLIRERAGDALVLVSAGGVASAADARGRLAAGAQLVQAYTALIYGGPFWAAGVLRGLRGGARLLGRR